MRPRLKAVLLVLGALFAGAAAATCRPDTGGGEGDGFWFFDAGKPPVIEDDADVPQEQIPPERCHISLDRFKAGGTGALAKQVAGPADLVGGPTAAGKVGDYLLANDRIRVIVQGKDRHIGAQPYGATILDADLVRPAGTAGRDQFGETGLLYNFGRTVEPTFFEILSDGSQGGAAVLAMSGHDTANDYLGIRNQLKNTLGAIPAADPYVELPLKITNYFILNPGESRVRFVTSFCNEGDKEVVLAAGDLTDPGYAVEHFNPKSCTNGFGYGGPCIGLDTLDWFGYQGDGVAYGYAPYKTGAPTIPETSSGILTIAGITGTVIGTPGFLGLLQWFDLTKTKRDGELRIPPADVRVIARDFVVGKDIGDVASIIESSRNALSGTATGEFSGTVTAQGKPVANARVAVERGSDLAGVFTTDDAGRFAGKLTAGSYSISAWAKGRIPTATQPLTLSKDKPATVAIDFKDPVRTLTVNATEVNAGGIPAKVTVFCNVCKGTPPTVNKYTNTFNEPIPQGVQLIGFTQPTGIGTFELPPGQYSVVVSRGPEYSIFPNTFQPGDKGVAVDLTNGDATVNATLARVLDTTGWMSADFHVHAVNSPDSVVENNTRALSFASEGVDVLVSTDHDFVTDFAPNIRAIGAEKFLASMIGEEMSTMEFGHYNVFPLKPKADDLVNAGAIDWAGPDGPTLTVAQMFQAGRKAGASTVHFNHPRGNLGGFTHLKADLDTLATHADPKDFRMAVPKGATAADTLILSADFNAIEVLNSGADSYNDALFKPNLNDWFTLLSRGLLVAGTGVSDTHHKYSEAAGYWRTFVNVGVDKPDEVSPALISDALNSMKAVATNGPFLKVSVARVDSTGKKTSPDFGIGETVEAGTNDLLVTVTAQAAAYSDLKKIELYTHLPTDDARCVPNSAGEYVVDPMSPNKDTTRVGCGGVSNRNWPLASILATKDLTGVAQLVPVVTSGGITYKRWQATVSFKVKAPTTDNWIVALVYGSKTLFPLAYPGGSPGGAPADVLPFAFTNPVLIDADGDGYDKPPFSAPPTMNFGKDGPKTVPLPLSLQEKPLRTTPVPPEEFLREWKNIAEAH